MRLLVYVKSFGPAQLVIPLIDIVKQNKQDEVFVIADGPAVEECIKAGIPLCFGGPTQKIPYHSFSDDLAFHLMKGIDPDVLILAPNGAPYMSELPLAAGARRAGVPIVYLEDFWGTSSRINVVADLFLVVDAYAEEMVRQRLATPPRSLSVCVVGNHAAVNVCPSYEALSFFEGLKQTFDLVFCFLGAGIEATTSEIKLFLDSLHKSALHSYCVIPCLHPGYAQNCSPSGASWGELWSQMFVEVLGDHVSQAPGLKTEEVVALSDVTFGGNSTDFVKSIVSGKRVISLLTKETQEVMKQQTGLTQTPMVALGLAEQIKKPSDLGPLLTKPLPDSSRLKPYNPRIAYNAVRELVIQRRY